MVIRKLYGFLLIFSLLFIPSIGLGQDLETITTSCGVDQASPVTISLSAKNPKLDAKTIIFTQPFNKHDRVHLRVKSANWGKSSTCILFHHGDSLVHSLDPVIAIDDYYLVAKMFDRITVLVKATADGAPTGQAHIYTAKRIVSKPVPVKKEVIVCEGEPFTLEVLNPQNNLIFSWYGPGRKPLPDTSKTYTASLPLGTYTFYVSTYYSDCRLYRSESEEITVKVVEKVKGVGIRVAGR